MILLFTARTCERTNENKLAGPFSSRQRHSRTSFGNLRFLKWFLVLCLFLYWFFRGFGLFFVFCIFFIFLNFTNFNKCFMFSKDGPNFWKEKSCFQATFKIWKSPWILKNICVFKIIKNCSCFQKNIRISYYLRLGLLVHRILGQSLTTYLISKMLMHAIKKIHALKKVNCCRYYIIKLWKKEAKKLKKWLVSWLHAYNSRVTIVRSRDKWTWHCGIYIGALEFPPAPTAKLLARSRPISHSFLARPHDFVWKLTGQWILFHTVE